MLSHQSTFCFKIGIYGLKNLFSDEYQEKNIGWITESFNLMRDNFCPITLNDKLFYHYTDHQGAHGIINSSGFWATDSFYLNDSSEGVYGKELLNSVVNEEIDTHFTQKNEKDIAKKLVEASFQDKSIRNSRTYIVSFCEKGDLLSQWRGYAGGSGISLGLSKQFFTTSIEMQNYPKSSIEWEFFKVSYGNDAKLIAQKLAKIIIKEISWYIQTLENVFDKVGGMEFFPNLNILSNIYDRFIAVVKHEGFAEENEWRLVGIEKAIPNIKIRPSSQEMTPFVEFDFPIDFYRIQGFKFEIVTVKLNNESNDDIENVLDDLNNDSRDGLNYLKEIIVGPTAHFERSKRAIEELIKIKSYKSTALTPQTDFHDKENLRQLYNRQDLHQFRNNFNFEMPEIKRSMTPFV